MVDLYFSEFVFYKLIELELPAFVGGFLATLML